MVILELGIEELSHGVLAAGFAKGAVAALVHCKTETRGLWAHLMADESEVLPWEAPLVDIARNHHGSTDITLTLGDAFYFQPGQHAYIARKIEIARDDASGQFAVNPPAFHQGGSLFAPSGETLAACWSIGERIMLALTPEGSEQRPYRVAIQRLKYQANWLDFNGLMEMTENSLARWGRIGFALDRNRQRLARPLSQKGPSDFLGMLMMLPILRSIVAGLNALAARFDTVHHCDPSHRIVERAHCDERYFSGLYGSRDTVRTEVFADGKWVELPIGMDSIAIFPGKMAARHFGLRPTLHRVLHIGDGPGDRAGEARTRNVTVLIGAV